MKQNDAVLELLTLQAAAWGIRLDARAAARLEAYADLLATYDRANVIGTREPSEIITNHVLDSLSCLLYEPLMEADLMADVGSGGGLPGIPLKVVRPQAKLVLIESTAKKADFLCRAVERLSLEDVAVLNARAEEVAHLEAYRAAHDVVTARAVARLSVVAEYGVPLLAVGGSLVAMKGRISDEELSEGERAAERLGARVSEIVRVPLLPEIGKKERRLVVIRKLRRTPAKYPRRPGVAGKQPLGAVGGKKT